MIVRRSEENCWRVKMIWEVEISWMWKSEIYGVGDGMSNVGI